MSRRKPSPSTPPKPSAPASRRSPTAAISEVVDFIRLIKLKFPEDDAVSEKKSLFGVWKNEPFYMSPDFDEPLEDFLEYM